MTSRTQEPDLASSLATVLLDDIATENKVEPADSRSDYSCITTTGERISIPASTVEKVPYLAALLNAGSAGFAPCERDSDGTYRLPAELSAPYIQVVLAYLEEQNHPQILLTHLPCGAQFSRLLRLFDLMSLSEPTAESDDLDALTKALKNIKDSHEKICRRGWQFKSARSGRVIARNAATTLCVGLASNRFQLFDPKVRTKLYNAFLYIISHRRTFRRRLRTHAYSLLKQHGNRYFTPRQWSTLDEWKPKARNNGDSSAEDTESDSSEDFYDSECDFDYCNGYSS